MATMMPSLCFVPVLLRHVELLLVSHVSLCEPKNVRRAAWMLEYIATNL